VCWKQSRIRALKVVWDPANAYVSGETPYPDGYRCLAAERIAHVHAKDCRVEGQRPIWCALGEGGDRLEGADPGAGGGQLQRLDQPGDALGRVRAGTSTRPVSSAERICKR
jgi:hypothetical protein